MAFTQPHILSLSLSTLCYPDLNPTKTSRNPNFSSIFRCFSSSRRNWGPNSDPFRAGRVEFDEELGFEGRKKRRNWWSDDDDDDDDDEDDDDDDENFGFWEEPSSIGWIFKVFKAFGWMVPAIIVSTLMGTGSNSLIMALVLPLGQTALSLVMDKLWGGPTSDPDPIPRSRPRGGSRSRTRTRPRSKRYPNPSANGKGRESKARKHSTRRDYQSWEGSRIKNTKSSFGGWDELDEQVIGSANFSRDEQNQKPDTVPLEQLGSGKLSRRRSREKPLFIRFLIAVFPILDSWTRWFF